MAYNEQQQALGLENQLRNMILNNASNGPPTVPPVMQYPANQPPPQNEAYRGPRHQPRNHSQHQHYHAGQSSGAPSQGRRFESGNHDHKPGQVPFVREQRPIGQTQWGFPPQSHASRADAGALQGHLPRGPPPPPNVGQVDPNAFERRPARGPPHRGPSHHGPPHHGPPHHGLPHHGPPQHSPQHHGPPHHGPQHHGPPYHGPPPHHQRPQQLYSPLTTTNGPGMFGTFNDNQRQYLEQVAAEEIPHVEMAVDELQLKEAFRIALEKTCQSLKSPDPSSPLPAIELHGFGSLSSGFASAGSDMDVAIVTDSSEASEHQVSMHENSLPRVLEKELLNLGLGARLLTRTRVPIIKVCEKPSPELLDALRKERETWEALPDDEKYGAEKAATENTAPKLDDAGSAPDTVDFDATKDTDLVIVSEKEKAPTPLQTSAQDSRKLNEEVALPTLNISTSTTGNSNQPNQANRQRAQRPWARERAGGPLDFPKQGVGIQCDINFFNPLGIHNTKMLRCYSKCDSRVRPMILFIKAWAKRRKINSSYSGTLSSYGYVLMVLHYLINIAQPSVLPNLQLEAHRMGLPAAEVDGWEVKFYGDEDEIVRKALLGGFTQNRQPVGALLLGFFQYYAQPAQGQGFVWTQDVLSLRTPGGVLTKQEKGWTGAKTEKGDNKEVRHRYLFAIEDPFETTHNVARTVSHPGICAIRDEFRRTWRILSAVGRRQTPHDGELFAELQEKPYESSQVHQSAPAQIQPPTQVAPPAKAEDYSQAFPSLGGPTKTSGPTIKKQNARNNMSKTQNGVISGPQAKAHLETFKRGKQLAAANRNNSGGASTE